MSETSRFWNGSSTGDASIAPYDANTEFAEWAERSFGATRNNSGVVTGTYSESAQLDPLQVTQNSPTGMSVLVNIGAALVDGTTYYNDAALTVTVAANASGNPRIDTIVLRKSFAAQTVRAAILQGTPAASPVPPTLTQSAGVTWEIPLADIAVANGAVSITNANITNRAMTVQEPEGVYLSRILNSTGAVLQSGNFAYWGTGANRSAIISPTGASKNSAGLWQERTAAAANGRVLNRGIGYLRHSAGSVTRGQFATPGSSGNSDLSLERTLNSIGMMIESSSISPALAFIDAGLRPMFGQLAVTGRLTGAAANLSVSIDSPYNTLFVEWYARGTNAATSDTLLFRPNADATIGNYRCYRLDSGGTAPTFSGTENIGATAGIQAWIPGNTATASIFGSGFFLITNILQNGIKFFVGVSGYNTTDLTGGFHVQVIYGTWNNASAITSLLILANSGSNLAANTYLNIFGKQSWL